MTSSIMPLAFRYVFSMLLYYFTPTEQFTFTMRFYYFVITEFVFLYLPFMLKADAVKLVIPSLETLQRVIQFV